LPVSTYSETTFWRRSVREVDGTRKAFARFCIFDEELLDLCYKDPVEIGIFRTVTYTLGISTTDIIARCKAVGLE